MSAPLPNCWPTKPPPDCATYHVPLDGRKMPKAAFPPPSKSPFDVLHATNAVSAPVVVPPLLVPTTRKWYVVPQFKPVTEAATATGDVPDPGPDVTIA